MDNFQIAQSQFFTALLHLIKKNVAWFLISKDIAAFSTCNQIETLKTVYNAILVSTTFIIWLKIYIWATISPNLYLVNPLWAIFWATFEWNLGEILFKPSGHAVCTSFWASYWDERTFEDRWRWTNEIPSNAIFASPSSLFWSVQGGEMMVASVH